MKHFRLVTRMPAVAQVSPTQVKIEFYVDLTGRMLSLLFGLPIDPDDGTTT